MRRWLIVTLMLGGLVLKAQLPKEYTTSVYEQVKHPFPLFDSLGVVSKETYFYKKAYDGDDYYYSDILDTLTGDSILVSSIKIDNKSGTIRTSFLDLSEIYRNSVNYIFQDGNLVKKESITWDLSGKKPIVEGHHIKTFQWNNGKIYSSKEMSIEQSDTTILNITSYNRLGFPIQSKITKERNLDSLYRTIVYNYIQDSIINNIVRTADLVYYTSEYGSKRWANRIKKYRIKNMIHTKHESTTIQKHQFIYDSKRRLVQEKCLIDTLEPQTKTYAYTNIGQLEEIVVNTSPYKFLSLYDKRVHHPVITFPSGHVTYFYDNLDRIKKVKHIGTLDFCADIFEVSYLLNYSPRSVNYIENYEYYSDGSYKIETKYQGSDEPTISLFSSDGRHLSYSHGGDSTLDNNENLTLISDEKSNENPIIYYDNGLHKESVIKGKNNQYIVEERSFYNFKH